MIEQDRRHLSANSGRPAQGANSEIADCWTHDLQLPSHGRTLQEQIDQALEKLTEKRIINANQRIGLLILDPSTTEVLAAHNHDQLLQSGSMFKMFVALAAFDSWCQGKKELNVESADFNLIRAMLSKSDNYAANTLIKKLGGPQTLTAYLRSKFPEFAEVDISELIPDSGASYHNTATPTSYCKLLQHLTTKSFDFSDQFLDLLNINTRTRFCGHRTNYVVPQDLKIWHKTGSTSRCCGEAALISPSGRIDNADSYIISVIVDRTQPAFHYEAWIDLVAPVVGAIGAIAYEFQRTRFDLKKGDRELSNIDCLK